MELTYILRVYLWGVGEKENKQRHILLEMIAYNGVWSRLYGAELFCFSFISAKDEI